MRIILTGTPMQNNLMECKWFKMTYAVIFIASYIFQINMVHNHILFLDYCMVQFVKPNLLGTMKEFKTNFVNPISNGQYQDSTAEDIRFMHTRTHVLHKLLKGTIQVCTPNINGLIFYISEKLLRICSFTFRCFFLYS